jgi:hypothetical protein
MFFFGRLNALFAICHLFFMVKFDSITQLSSNQQRHRRRAVEPAAEIY